MVDTNRIYRLSGVHNESNSAMIVQSDHCPSRSIHRCNMLHPLYCIAPVGMDWTKRLARTMLENTLCESAKLIASAYSERQSMS